MGGTESALHGGASFRHGQNRKSPLTRSQSLPPSSRRPHEVTSRPKVNSIPRAPPLSLPGSQVFRGSPPAWRRHSLAGINEEDSTDGSGREAGVTKGRSNSIRSEGGYRTEDKPRWILYRKYRNDGSSSNNRGQPTSGETPVKPGNRYGHGPGAPNSTHYEQSRPLGAAPRRPLPQRLLNSIQPHGSHSFPLELAPTRVSSEPPPIGRGRREAGRARQMSTSSEPPSSARAASEPGRRHREASSSSESGGGRHTRPASTASEPGGRRRPLHISVTYNEIRRERRLPHRPDKLLSEQLLKNAGAVDHVTKTAAEVQQVVSPHDADLVKNHVSVLERKRADLGQTVEHHASTAQQTAAANETLMASINDFSEWLRELLLQLEHPPAIGVSVAEGEAALQQHYESPMDGQESYDEVDTRVSNDTETEIPDNLASIPDILQLEEACFAVVHDIESHQTDLDAMRRQSSSLLRDLSPAERAALEMTLAGVSSDYCRLAAAADSQRKVISQQVARREALQRDVDRVRTWLGDREEGVRHAAATVRLRSADVEKDIERYKMLLSEVKNYRSNISKLYEQVDDLLDHTSATDSHSLSETLNDISKRYAALVSTLEETLARNQNSLSARKQYESGVLRLDLWRKETELICSTELQLDSPLEFLDEQHRKQKNLDQESRTFDSTIKDLYKQAESISHELTEADKVTLKDSMNKNRDEFYRVAVLVRKRMKLLSEALASKSRMEGELLAASRWLYNTQDELRRISHTIGHRREDAYIMLDQAKNISEQVEAFEKTLTGLQQTADQAKALDQPTAAEEVARLLTVYTEMREQVTTLCQKLEAAVALREAYSTSKAEMETCLKQGHEQLEAVRVLGVSVPTKLERYKTVEETLSSKGPLLAQIEEKGQQICIEGTPADSRQIREQVTALRVKADNLKQQCDREAAELKQVMIDRLAFASELKEQIEQLKQKETDLEARDIFGLSPESVEKELDFYYDERHRVFAQLQAVHEQVQEHRSRYDQLEEAIPLEVQDRMDEFETLRETILEKLKAKGEYLNTVKEERLAYSAAWRVVNDWLTSADSHVQPNYQGIDLTSVEEQLQKHKAVFADQDTIEAKLTQLSQTARSIEPTLDINDKTTMQQSLDNLQQRYAEIAKSAQQKEANLLQCAEKWQLYQTTLSQLNTLLKEAEERWETTSECAPRSLPDLHHHVADTQEYSASLDAHLELVEVLNTTSQELDERASSSSQTQIEQSIRNVNERWNILKTKATDKDKALQDTVDTWTSYCQLASQLQNVCETVNKKLGKEDVKTLTMQELVTKQQETSTAGEMLETNANTMSELQKTTEGVLTKLPSCDAKVAIQKELLQLQDKYEQHQWSCKEQQQNLESELVDRERLNNVLREGVAVLSSVPELLTPTDLLPLEAATIDEKLTAHEKLRKDINLKIQQVKIVVDSQQEKYAEDGGMPMDLEQSLEELRSLEAQSDEAFKVCEEKLKHARSSRVQHQAGVETLSNQLEKADSALSDSKLTRADNDKVLSDLDALAPTIAALEDSASEIASTVSTEEGQSVQDTIAELRAQWVLLSEKADTKAVLLAEISDLRGRFDRDAAVVQAWITQSEEALKSDLVWTNLHTVQTQLAEYRSLMAKSIPIQGRLEEMGELADRLASREGREDALEEVTSLSTVHTKTYNEVTQRLNTLEEASVLYLTYSSEIEIVARWMQQTRQAFKVAQRAPTLTEQLSLQDALVKDIEHHEGRVKSILVQHDKLREIAEQLAPTHGGKELAAEIADLKEAALQRREQLANAVDEEKKHDEQIQELSTIMSTTRATLEAAPAVAGTVEELHQQIQEHNALTEQLASAKMLVDELTEKNRILREQIHSISPIGDKLQQEQVLPNLADLSSNDDREIDGASVDKSQTTEIVTIAPDNVESIKSQDLSMKDLTDIENVLESISEGGSEKADIIHSVPGEATVSKEYQLNNPVSQQTEVLQTCSNEVPSQRELTESLQVETSSLMTETSQIQTVTSDETISYYTENSAEDTVTRPTDVFEVLPNEEDVEQPLKDEATLSITEDGHYPEDDAVYEVAEIQQEPLDDSVTSNVDVVERPLNEATLQTSDVRNLAETTEMDLELQPEPVSHKSTLSDPSVSPVVDITERPLSEATLQQTDVLGNLAETTEMDQECHPETVLYHSTLSGDSVSSQVDIVQRPLNEALLQQTDAIGYLAETTEMEQGMQQELSHQSTLSDESVPSQVDIADMPLNEAVLQQTDALIETTEMHQESVSHQSTVLALNETVLQKEMVLHHLPGEAAADQISVIEGLPNGVTSQSTEVAHKLPDETGAQPGGHEASKQVEMELSLSNEGVLQETTDSSKPIDVVTSHLMVQSTEEPSQQMETVQALVNDPSIQGVEELQSMPNGAVLQNVAIETLSKEEEMADTLPAFETDSEETEQVHGESDVLTLETSHIVPDQTVTEVTKQDNMEHSEPSGDLALKEAEVLHNEPNGEPDAQLTEKMKDLANDDDSQQVKLVHIQTTSEVVGGLIYVSGQELSGTQTQTMLDSAALEHTGKIESLEVIIDRGSQQAEVVQTLPVEESSHQIEMVEDIPSSSQQELEQTLIGNAASEQTVSQSQPDETTYMLTEEGPESATSKQIGNEEGILHIAISTKSELLESLPRSTSQQAEGDQASPQQGLEQSLPDDATSEKAEKDVSQQTGVLETQLKDDTSQHAEVNQDLTIVAAQLVNMAIEGALDQIKSVQHMLDEVPQDTKVLQSASVKDTDFKLPEETLESLDEASSKQTDIVQSMPDESTSMQTEMVEDLGTSQQEDLSHKTATTDIYVVQSEADTAHSTQTETIQNLSKCELSQQEDMSPSLPVEPDSQETEKTQNLSEELVLEQSETVEDLSNNSDNAATEQSLNLPKGITSRDTDMGHGLAEETPEQHKNNMEDPIHHHASPQEAEVSIETSQVQMDTVQNPSDEIHLEESEKMQHLATDKSLQQSDELQSLPVGMDSQEIESIEGELASQQEESVVELQNNAAQKQSDELQYSTSNASSLHADMKGFQEISTSQVEIVKGFENDAVSEQAETWLNSDTSQQAEIDQNLSVKAAQIVKVVIEGALDQVNTKQDLPDEVSQGTEVLQDVSVGVTDSEQHLSEEPMSEQGEIAKRPENDLALQEHYVADDTGSLLDESVKGLQPNTEQMEAVEAVVDNLPDHGTSQHTEVLQIQADEVMSPQSDAVHHLSEEAVLEGDLDDKSDDGVMQLHEARSQLIGTSQCLQDEKGPSEMVEIQPVEMLSELSEMTDTASEQVERLDGSDELASYPTEIVQDQSNDVVSHQANMVENQSNIPGTQEHLQDLANNAVTEHSGMVHDQPEVYLALQEAELLHSQPDNQLDTQLAERVQDIANAESSRQAELVTLEGLTSDAVSEQSDIVHDQSNKLHDPQTDMAQGLQTDTMSEETELVHGESDVLAVQQNDKVPGQAVNGGTQPDDMDHSQPDANLAVGEAGVSHIESDSQPDVQLTEKVQDIAIDDGSPQADMTTLHDPVKDAGSEQSDIVPDQSNELASPQTDMLPGIETDATSEEKKLVHGESDVLAVQQNDIVPDLTVTEEFQLDEMEHSQPGGSLALVEAGVLHIESDGQPDTQLTEKVQDLAIDDGSQQAELETLPDLANDAVSKQPDIVHDELNEELGQQTDATSEETDLVHGESDVLAVQQNEVVPEQADTEVSQQDDMDHSKPHHDLALGKAEVLHHEPDAELTEKVKDLENDEGSQQVKLVHVQTTSEEVGGLIYVSALEQSGTQTEMLEEQKDDVTSYQMETDDGQHGVLSLHEKDMAEGLFRDSSLLETEMLDSNPDELSAKQEELCHGSADGSITHQPEGILAQPDKTGAQEHVSQPQEALQGLTMDKAIQQKPEVASLQAELKQSSTNDSSSEKKEFADAQQGQLVLQKEETMQYHDMDEPFQREGILLGQTGFLASEKAELIQGSSEQADFEYAQQKELALQQGETMPDHDPDVPLQQVGILHDQQDGIASQQEEMMQDPEKDVPSQQGGILHDQQGIPVADQAEMAQSSGQDSSYEQTDSGCTQQDELALQQGEILPDHDMDEPFQQEGILLGQTGFPASEKAELIQDSSEQADFGYAQQKELALQQGETMPDQDPDSPLQQVGILHDQQDEIASQQEEMMQTPEKDVPYQQEGILHDQHEIPAADHAEMAQSSGQDSSHEQTDSGCTQQDELALQQGEILPDHDMDEPFQQEGILLGQTGFPASEKAELIQDSSEQADFGYAQQKELALQQGETMPDQDPDSPLQQVGILHDQQDEIASQQEEMMQTPEKDVPYQQGGILHDQQEIPAADHAEMAQSSGQDSSYEQTDSGCTQQDELALQQGEILPDHDKDEPFQQEEILHDQTGLPVSEKAELVQGPSAQDASSEQTDSEYAQEGELHLQQRETMPDRDKDTLLQQGGMQTSEHAELMDGHQKDVLVSRQSEMTEGLTNEAVLTQTDFVQGQSDELPSKQTEIVHAAVNDANPMATDMVLDHSDELPLHHADMVQVLDEEASHHRDLMISQVNKELAPQQEEGVQGLVDDVGSQQTDMLQGQPADTPSQQAEMVKDLANDASSQEISVMDVQPNEPGSYQMGDVQDLMHEAGSEQTETLQSQPDEVTLQSTEIVTDVAKGAAAAQQTEMLQADTHQGAVHEILDSQSDNKLVLQQAEVQRLADDGAIEQEETIHSHPEEGRVEYDEAVSDQTETLGPVKETNANVGTLPETSLQYAQDKEMTHIDAVCEDGVDTSNDLTTNGTLQYLPGEPGHSDETASEDSSNLMDAAKQIILDSVTHTTSNEFNTVEESDSPAPIFSEGTAELELQHHGVNDRDKDLPGSGNVTVVDNTLETQFADNNLLSQVEKSQKDDAVCEIDQLEDVKDGADRAELESVQDNIPGHPDSVDPTRRVTSEGDSSQDMGNLDESFPTLEHTLTESTFTESTADKDMTTHSLESGALADEDEEELLELTAGSDGNTWRNSSQSPRTLSIASPGSNDQSLCSEFVAIPYLQEVLNRSRHSGTDHSMSLPLSMSRTSTPSVTEINMSWTSLQDQLAQRSEDLNTALGQQEKFQQSVQNVTRHVNDVLTRLDDLQTVTSLEDATNKLKELQTLRIEVETVYEDVAGIKEQGQAISAKAGPEGCAPMNLTLQMLDDQLRHLEDKLTDSENRLQEQYEEQEHKTKELLAYETAVADIEKWVSVARECIVREHYLGQDPEALQQQLLKAQVEADFDLFFRASMVNMKQVQEQLPARLQQLSDLAVTADHLAELGPPETAATLQQQVAGLRANAEKFGLQLAQTTEQLKDEVKVAERKKQELVEYKTSVVNIQRWIEDIQLNGSADETDRTHGDSQNLGDGLIRPQRQSSLGAQAPSSPEEREDSMSRSLADLQDLWRGVQEAEAAGDEQLARQRREQFYRRYQEVARIMASWLDDVELALFSTGFDRGTEQQLKENEMMQEELASLGQYISVMKDISKQIAGSQDSRDSSLCDTVRNLSERVDALEAESEQRQRELQSCAGSMHEFEEELRLAQTPFTDIQQRLSILLQSTAPLEAQLADMESLEGKLLEYDEQFGRLSQRSEGMLDSERTFPPMELTLLQSRWAELREQVAERKHEILAGMEMQSQYEKLLNEYAEFIETAERKLDEEERLQAVNLPDMKQQLEAHKEFFSGLESHRIMLDGMAEKVDPSTWQQLEVRHTSLTSQTQATEHRAALHRQRLEQTLRQWEDFDRHFDSARDCLHRLEQQRPVKVEKEQDMEKLRRRIWDYNSIQSVLVEEKPSMFQCVEKGKQLLQKVTCPALQSDIADFSDQLLRINNDTSSELKRLETLVDQWEIYERESADLEEWLMAAKEQLGRISTTDDVDLQNISAIRSKIDSFLDFRKEIESKQAQKTKVSVLGQQLQRLRPSDTQLRDGLERLETDWLRLMCDLPNNEEALHAAQMELLPSRQALGELNLWMDSVESSVHDDHHDYCSLLDVQMALQKYRGLKVDLSNKQLTVDFVNQMSMQSTEGLADTEFDEKLGRVNARYQLLSSDLAEQLRTLELLQVRWEEYDQVINRMRNWFSDQEAKVTKLQHVGHDVSVRRSVAELKTIHEELTKKEAEIDAAKVLGTGLLGAEGETPGGADALSAHMEDINNSWARLDHEVYQLLNTLEDVLQQWDAYNSGLQEVNSVLMEAESILKHYNTASGDLSTFSEQLVKLRAMQSKVDTVKGDLDQLQYCGGELNKVCEESVGQTVLQNIHSIEQRWEDVRNGLDDRVVEFEDTLDQWESYDEACRNTKAWLKQHEKSVAGVLQEDDGGICTPQHVSAAKALCQELEAYQPHLMSLSRLSNQLGPRMDGTALIHLRATETSLNQQHGSLLSTLTRHVDNVQKVLKKYTRFREILEALQRFLTAVEATLAEEDPVASADEEAIRLRIKALQELLGEVGEKQSSLDELNHIGYRLPLNKEDTAAVREVNARWQGALSDASQRYRQLQANLLLRQDFHEKCLQWGHFLARVERALAEEIAGNYKALVDQQRAFEMFETEMHSRQQVLHAIIKEGEQMVTDGDVEEKVEFQQKLAGLQEQWHSVLVRARERKGLIDSGIGQWHAYRNQLDRMNTKIDEMEDIICNLDFPQAPVQKIKLLLESIKHLYGHLKQFNVTACLYALAQLSLNANFEMHQRDMTSSEPIYQKLTSLSEQLQATSEPGVSSSLRRDLTAIQERWVEMARKLEDRRVDLERLMGNWSSTEAGIDDIVTWLREIRLSLAHELPDNYDQLEHELRQCKEFQAAFVTHVEKRDALAAHEESLAVVISPEDLAVLQQRLRLLSKQWEEIRQQVTTRQHRLAERLAEWTRFGEQYTEMLGWVTAMENKVNGGQEFHMEDMLTKLQKDYKTEMADKTEERNKLVTHGRRLMAGSSEVRANDIDYKIRRLLDKWQRLEDQMATRHKKLQETLQAVQQLESNMSGLRRWLAYIEHELGSPVVFHHPDMPEIQTKLHHHQDLQKDVEKHSAGVASVLNLCEVLLHDHDACPSDVECGAIEQAMCSLDKRWKNICSLVSERRQKIEETWELWQHFHDDHLRLDEWLRYMEVHTRSPCCNEPTFDTARQELKKFETFQQEFQANISQLEALNRQYRRLAREGRTDTAGTLKRQAETINKRWDQLQGTVTSITRRLKHTINVKDDFEATRQALIMWLNNLNMQISKATAPPNTPEEAHRKASSVSVELEHNQQRVEYLEKAGLYLMQKCEPADAVLIERDLSAFRNKHQEVKTNLDLLMQRLNAEDDEEEISDEDLLQPQSLVKELSSATYVVRYKPQKDSPTKKTKSSKLGLHMYEIEPVYGAASNGLSSPEGDVTPPSEQDSEPEEETREKLTGSTSTLNSGTSPVSPWEAVLQALAHKSTAKRLEVEGYLRDLDRALTTAENQLDSIEKDMKRDSPLSHSGKSSPSKHTARLVPIQNSMDMIHRLEKTIRDELGLINLGSGGERRIRAAVKRWNALNTQAQEKDFKSDQKRHEWLQFSADLRNLTEWVQRGKAEMPPPGTSAPSNLRELEAAIRKHKDFNIQLENKKPIVISINILSKSYLSPGSPNAEELKDKLTKLNRGFDDLCTWSGEWQSILQKALVESTDFTRTVEQLQTWMKDVDGKMKDMLPVSLGAEKEVLLNKYGKLKVLHKELEYNSARVSTLHDIACHLPASQRTPGLESAITQLAALRDRMNAAHKTVASQKARIETALNIKTSPTHSFRSESGAGPEDRGVGARSSTPRLRTKPSLFTKQPQLAAASDQPAVEFYQDLDNSAGYELGARRQFVSRVLRTAVPLQMMLLLLLGVACLVPMSEEDFSCVLANNFKRSLDPMLHYTDGPPPF